MDFTWFHRIVAIAVLGYALWDMVPMRRRQYLFGAEIYVGVVVLSELARTVSHDIAPVLLYALIDIMAVSLYAIPMFRKKAAWAAACVLFSTAMLISHLLFFLAGEAGQSVYLWLLGIFSVFTAAAIILGTMAGRHEFGRGWDDFVYSCRRGWSWSGSVASRLCDYKEEMG